MRVGIITGEYPPMQGGVGAYTKKLAGGLASHHHDVFVFTSKQITSVDDQIKFRVDHIASGWGPGSIVQIHRWINRIRPDLLNIQFETAAYRMSPWVHFIPDFVRRVPVVTTFHDLLFPYLLPGAGRLRPWIVQHLASRSDGVIATNHEDYARLNVHQYAALIPIGSNVSTKLPNHYNREAWRKCVDATDKTLVLVYFGFMNRSKGIETLLYALKILIDENIPSKLVIIGGRTGSSDPANQHYAHEIDSLIDNLSMAAHIYQTGFIDDVSVAAYLGAGDVVVLPFTDGASYRRGSLMAAIQQSCAIITTQPYVEIPTFIDGENMLFFPPGDVHRLVMLLKKLYMEPAQINRLSEQVRGIADHFSWDKITDEMIKFFETLIHAKA